jgi:hypothetical protein
VQQQQLANQPPNGAQNQIFLSKRLVGCAQKENDISLYS